MQRALALLLLASTAHAASLDVQAHRGGEWGEPESSLAAFRQALAHGIPTLELDIQATPDGRLFVAHDAGFDARVAPLLDDVLALVQHAPYAARLSVEIKRQRPVAGLGPRELAALTLDALTRHDLHERCIVQSFDPDVLAAMRDAAPGIPTSMLVRDRAGWDEALQRSRADILSPRAGDLRREDVSRLAARGISVIPWVVDDPEQARRLASWGVAGLISNHPQRILEALASLPSGDPMASRSVASSLLAASLALSVAPGDAAAAPRRPRDTTARDVDVVAVYPFTSGGNVDTFCTSLFVKEANRQEVFRDIIDSYELSITTPDGQPFQPQPLLPTLVTEARDKGADALLLGEGKWYDWGFRMEFRLIETEGGTVAWSGAYSSGLHLSGPGAKRELVRKAVRNLRRARE